MADLLGTTKAAALFEQDHFAFLVNAHRLGVKAHDTDMTFDRTRVPIFPCQCSELGVVATRVYMAAAASERVRDEEKTILSYGGEEFQVPKELLEDVRDFTQVFTRVCGVH